MKHHSLRYKLIYLPPFSSGNHSVCANSSSPAKNNNAVKKTIRRFESLTWNHRRYGVLPEEDIIIIRSRFIEPCRYSGAAKHEDRAFF